MKIHSRLQVDRDDALELRTVIVALLVTMTLLIAGCQPTTRTGINPVVTLTSSPTAMSTTAPTLMPTLSPTLASTDTPAPTATRRATHTLQPTRTASPVPTLSLGTLSGPFRLMAAVDEVVAGDVQSLQSTADGTLWLIADRGVARLVDSTWTPYITDIAGKVVGVDTTGRVWVVNEDTSQIAAWDGSSWITYGAEAGWAAPPDDGFRYIRGGLSDAAGQLWFAASHEVRVFKQDHWTTYTLADMKMDPGGVEDDITDFKINITRKGTVWIGECDWSGPGPLGGRGARWFDGQAWHGAQTPAATGCVTDIAEDQAGYIWLGIDENLWRYDPDTEVWTDFPTDEPLLIEAHHRYIASIKIGPDGDPWTVVMLCGGASCYVGDALYHVHAGKWRQIGAGDDFVGDQMYGPLFDSQGTAWLQRGDALYRVVGDTSELVSSLAGRHGAFDATGRLWIMAWYEGHPTLWTLSDEIKN